MRTMSPDPPARLKAVRALSRVSVSPVINGRAGSLTHGLAPAAVKAPASSAALTATRWKAIAAPPVDRIRVRVRPGAKSATGALPGNAASNGRTSRLSRVAPTSANSNPPRAPPPTGRSGGRDRKSVVEGKSVSVRVDLGGGRIIKKKNTIIRDTMYTTRLVLTQRN